MHTLKGRRWPETDLDQLKTFGKLTFLRHANRGNSKEQEENILDEPAAIHKFNDVVVVILSGFISGH